MNDFLQSGPQDSGKHPDSHDLYHCRITQLCLSGQMSSFSNSHFESLVCICNLYQNL